MSSNPEEDGDFDDFGDFEEAQQIEEEEKEVEFVESVKETPVVGNESFSQPIDVHLLSDLLDDDGLWKIDTNPLNDQSEINLFDLFSQFACTDLESVPEGVRRSIEMWQLLHVVEETNALNFRWPSSQLCSHFIKALSFCESQQSSSGGICVPKPAGFLASGEFCVNRPIEEANELELASCSRNEWTLPDYSNNTNNAVDCDFFQSDYRDNAVSVLEQELKALGLSAPKSTKQVSQPVVNGTSHGAQKTDAPRYLSVSELNNEARTFYERMPDFSFLLVDRVLRDQ